MRVVFMPKDGERQAWPFEPDDVEMVDASFIKKQTGLSHGDWKKAILEEDADARHGLLWVLLKQENPLYRWTDVRFRMSELTLEFDDSEIDLIIDRLASLTPDEAADPNVTGLRLLLEAQGVDVAARIADRTTDPEFVPVRAEDAEDPKA